MSAMPALGIKSFRRHGRITKLDWQKIKYGLYGLNGGDTAIQLIPMQAYAGKAGSDCAGPHKLGVLTGVKVLSHLPKRQIVIVQNISAHRE